MIVRRGRPGLKSLVLALALLVLPISGGQVARADPTGFAPPPAGWEHHPSTAVRYEPPGDGPVRRRFEPPLARYGAGHRGVDLEVAVGAPVRAAANGTVVFAGSVAGTTWLSIAHADGITTSYGPVAQVTVGRGDEVARGEPIGRLASGGHGDGDIGLHWGARRGPTYIDPLSLLTRGVPRPSLIGDGTWRATGHAVTPYSPWGGGRWFGLGYHGSPPAHRPGFAVAPNPNHLVMVAGLGSSSSTVPIDPEHLGYDLRDVTALSYAGRSDGMGAADDPRRDQLPYRSADTWDGVEAASLLLRDQLRAQYVREPGRAVDLVGHSMGGVVIVHYLAHHHDAYDRSLPPIGNVVTVASPLQGSDIAALGTDVRAHRLYGRALDHVHGRLVESDGPAGRHVGSMPLDAPAIDDLRVGSPLLDRLADGMGEALLDRPAGALAMGTRVLTIGGGTDVVVGAGRSSLPDASEVEHRILPGGHGAVLGSEAVREVVWRFLAGEEVVDSPGRLSTAVSAGAGHLVRSTGRHLAIDDALLAPLLPDRDQP